MRFIVNSKKVNKLKLGVNIDHVATLRMARKTTYPSVLEAAAACETAGADGITVHLREDRRHIQDSDVYELRKALTIKMNLEMANNREIVNIALQVKPDEVCIVPEKRAELTTEGGLNVAGQIHELSESIKMLTDQGITVSLFIDPDAEQIQATAELGVPFIELHTGTFCNASGEQTERELYRLVKGASLAHKLGINVNAGHGININNIAPILRIPYLNTLNIGHSIVSRAVFTGLEAAVKEMLCAMNNYDGGDYV
ncbi:MAG: pyridoxine 5'-phosphate synthase [Lentisphaerae bacterium]|nr:pyridoxine 5'-phosphate synthase [Lentisphaerota bacterium]